MSVKTRAWTLAASETVRTLAVFAAMVGVLPHKASAQGVELVIHLERASYFEGEPIYAAFELVNKRADTVWVRPFQLAYQHLTVTLSRSDGSVVPYEGMVADFAPGPTWRGVPVPPGGGLFDVFVLQDCWGSTGPSIRRVFLHHLDVGQYELSATFPGGQPGAVGREEIAALPIKFEIRPRNPREEIAFREFGRLREEAWTPEGRGVYVRDLLALVTARAAVADTDPFLPFLLHNGLQTAWAFGLYPDRASADRVGVLRERIAEAQRFSPGGAYVVVALAHDHPERIKAVLPLLGSGLAGRVAKSVTRPTSHR